jgi:tRNA nucleotidyltransferase (CCA-adding enzyme)
MSDYIYSLESHLNAAQNRLVAELQSAANAMNQNVYLAGGAMRDLLGGSPTRDLDFSLEGNPLKLAAAVAEKLGGTVVSQDDLRRTAELLLPGGVTAQLAMARQERYAKPGAKPQVTPASIREDLTRRDFTINAIALALNRGAKGLLIDPANGLADLGNRELRTTNSYAFLDDPSRLLRLIRLKHRLQFTVAERTARQFENAIEENLQRLIPASVLLDELKRLGDEPTPSETVKELETTKLLALFSPALAGSKVNYPALAKLEKLKKNLPLGSSGWVDGWRSFFIVLTASLTNAEKNDLYARVGMKPADVESCKKLQASARKLEAALKSPNLRKPSQIYQALNPAPPDEILFVLHESQQRIVQDRIKNYIQKYLPLAQEIPEPELAAAGALPGMPKFEKARDALIAARLNARPKKVETEMFVEVPDAPPAPAPRGRPARQG